mgnify:CR=1 FL=1
MLLIIGGFYVIYKIYKEGDSMKKRTAVVIVLAFFIVVGIVTFAILWNESVNPGKPVISTEEKIKQLNDYIYNSLTVSEDTYLKVYQLNNILTVKEYFELRAIASDLTYSIKITEEYNTDKFESDKPGRVYFVWKDIKIILDIDSNSPSNQVYVENSGTYYKAEISSESIREVAEFVSKM